MEAKSQWPKRRDDALPSLNAAIDALDLARRTTNVASELGGLLGSADVLLNTIKDSVINEADYVELGLACADICQTLERQIGQPGQTSPGVIKQLTTIMEEVRNHIVKWGQRNLVSRSFHAKDRKKAIAAWKINLDQIRRALNVEVAANADAGVHELPQDVSNTHGSSIDVDDDASNIGASGVGPDVLNTHAAASRIRHDAVHPNLVVSNAGGDPPVVIHTTSSIHRNALKHQGDAGGQNRAAYATAPGYSPPLLPRTTPVTNLDIRRDVLETRAIVSEVRRDVNEIKYTLKSREDDASRNCATQNSILGESPPPPPRVCFGRDTLIEGIVGLAENLSPIALLGTGGIGKTSIALTVLHHDRIRDRFGDQRWFIRCDQFSASQANFLSRLSRAIGATVENPEDLTPLRRYLSSKEMFIVLDNAESILDPQGADGRAIYRAVEELSQFPNICLVITSRITLVPPSCETLEVTTLSMDAARDVFHRIYKHGGPSDSIDNILKQLDFHPLSITLLATVAHQNKWDGHRLAGEWERHHTNVLRTDHDASLGATIELSLASHMFGKLGPQARELLGVIAFFPQGVDEANLDWLFPTISNVATILDKFCALSLTYRSGRFITMLVPLRDYLRPKDPLLSPLFCAARESYFSRLSEKPDPLEHGSKETEWIASEDANVEHLLDVLTSMDTSSDGVWRACARFMNLVTWHKPRKTVLGPKIERLPDDHNLKPDCLFQLAELFYYVGNDAEAKRLLTHTLKLEKERGREDRVALTLNELSDANRMLNLSEEGIHQAKEALGIYERLGDMQKQGYSLVKLAWSLHDDGQLDAAEEAASHAIQLLSDKGQEFRVCESHGLLGNIYYSKGEREKAIRHLDTALGIASAFNWDNQLFWIHFSLVMLFRDEDEFDKAHAHVEQAKSHAANNMYNLGRVIELRAWVFHRQCRSEDAKSEALRAIKIYEKLGTLAEVDNCRNLLLQIGQEMENSDTPVSTPSTPSTNLEDGSYD